MSSVFSIFLIAVFHLAATPQFASAATWDSFIPTALKSSPETKRIRLQYAVPELDHLVALQQLDWSLTWDSGFRRDRSEVPSIVQTNLFRLDQTVSHSLNMTKSFLTGTDLTFSAAKEDIRRRAPFITGTAQIFANSYLLTLEQNFWRNSLGLGIQDQLQAADKKSQVLRMEMAEALESALLQGAQLFWQAATWDVQTRESESVLKRLESLVKNVEQKHRNRYAAPGEYAQVQAQYFAQAQLVRLNKVRYRQAVNELKIFLPDWDEKDLRWSNIEPLFSDGVRSRPLALEQTRSFQLAELKKQQADQNAESVQSLNKPKLAFVGELGSTGVDPTNIRAEREWLQGRRPTYFVGLRFSHSFGSGVQEARIRAAKAQALAQEVSSDQDKTRGRQRAELLVEELVSLEENLKSQRQQLEALRQAVQELTTSFNQGRIDISVLIDILNQMQTAERLQIEARANLELRHLEWQFLFDEISVNQAW
jgi:outer membrane protein TolC